MQRRERHERDQAHLLTLRFAEPKPARMSDETPLFFEHLPGMFAVTLLQIGLRTGLLDAVLADGGTAQEVAERAGADTRNAAEWLRA